MKKIFITLLAVSFLSAPLVADAAIGFRGSAENSSTPSTDTTVDLTTISGLAEGDLVIVAASIGDDDGAAFTMTNNSAGYTKMNQISITTDTDDTYMALWYKIMTSSVDTDVVIEGTGPGTDAALAVVVMAFSGVDTTTPFDVASTSTTGIDTPNPNPPSINHNNPSGIWTVIAGGNSHVAGGACTFTFPTGYTTNAIDRGHNGTNDTTVGMGYRSSGVSDPEDPGTMTHSCANNATNSWAAFTMALRPALVSAPTVTTNTETNVTAISATLNGNVSATGGDTVTTRGFAWGTNSTLSTVFGTSSETGSFGTGTFFNNIGGLISGTTYYFRAYATNSAGTSYGQIDSLIAGHNTTRKRTIRLFQGYTVKFLGGRIVLHGVEASQQYPSFSGGTETVSGGYRYHTFTSDGTLTMVSPGTVDILVVGGGGGGGRFGANPAAGGGGGGEVIEATSVSVSSSLSITIGSAGAGRTASNGDGTSGGNTVISGGASYTADGGGGGSGTSGPGSAPSGGSGGGGSAASTASTGGASTASGGGLGNSGGTGVSSATTGDRGAGGGGGAGGTGEDGGIDGTGFGGDGGSGYLGFDGNRYGAGGGGGGQASAGASGQGGTGGGGDGGNTGSRAGSNATGNGNGGGGSAGDANGGNGSAGIVIVRYPI